MTANPVLAGSVAAACALALLLFIVMVRWSFGALGRRIMVGLGVRKKVEQDVPWATVIDRAEYGMRPPLARPWYAFWSKRA